MNEYEYEYNEYEYEYINDAIVRETAYDEGYEAGKQIMLDEIDDILDRCAHDNGAMLVRALKELKERYGVK